MAGNRTFGGWAGWAAGFLMTAAAADAHTVTAGPLNVRSGPGTGYAIVSSLSKGAVVQHASVSGSWMKITAPAAGWIHTAYVSDTSHTAYVNTSSLNLRSGPGATYGILGLLFRDQAVTLACTNAAGTWARVVFPVTGWVSRQYLTASAPPVAAQACTLTVDTNARNGPGTHYGIAALLAKGAVVRYTSISGAWMSIRLPVVGWIPAANVRAFPSTAYVGVRSLDVRNGPGADSGIVGRLVLNQQVSISHTNAAGTWARIVSPAAGWTVRASLAGDRVRPSAATTGVPAGVTLSPRYGDITVTAAGTVLDSLDIHGRVNVRAANVVIRRCRIRGKQTPPAPTEWIALVNAASDACTNLLVEDCEIAPTYPSAGANGIQGCRFTSRRNNIHDTVDGLGMMGPEGCRSESDYIHDLSYFSPDPGHADNQTHNDCIQFHSGGTRQWGGHVVVGSHLSAYVSKTSGTGNCPVPQALSCLMINKAVNLTVTDCWMEGGWMPVNGGDSGNVGLNLGRFWRNRFHGARIDGVFYRNPPFSIVMKKGSISDVGAGTANANRFHDNTEVVVRYY